MQPLGKKLLAISFAVALGLGLSACGDDVVDDGVEEEVDDVGNEVEDEVDQGSGEDNE